MASKTQHLSIISLELSNPLAEMRNAGLVCSVGFSAPGGAAVVVWGSHKAPWAAHSRAWGCAGSGGGPGTPCLCMGLLGMDGAWGIPSESTLVLSAALLPLAPLRLSQKDTLHRLESMNQPESLLWTRQASPASGGLLEKRWKPNVAAFPVSPWLVLLLSQQLPGLWITRTVHWPQMSAQSTRIPLESAGSPLGRHCLVENPKIQC